MAVAGLKTWTKVVELGHLELGLTETHPPDREAWDGNLRSAARLATPLY